ncbi:MAG: HipA domain-containing protein [Alphaproteobacteria bacterium]|nr:HipA domain-containing protein [Alphaproteobacteria bacterium]
MANLLWGKVYYKDVFAGYLREEPGGRVTFTYDNNYIEGGHPAIAHTLPVREQAHISNNGLHPFFDNLVSEGWLEQAQTRLLGRREVTRFELLLAFGFDCAGAVSIVDPERSLLSEAMLDLDDPKEMAVLNSRASLSGVQPKLAVVEEGGIYRPARINELSTHIAKFPSANHLDLTLNEYLTTLAFKALLPEDKVVEMDIGEVRGMDEPTLLIKRFDRGAEGRIHFEEFNQLLGRSSRTKYDGAHKDMADFILNTDGCLPIQAYLLYRRILVGLLLGNTDMHLKNFAMFHTDAGLRLTPSYDQVAASLYNYKTLALKIAGSKDHSIGDLKGRHLMLLGEEFGLSPAAINMAAQGIEKHIEAAKDAIQDAPLGGADFKDNLIKLIGKRWNGTFQIWQSIKK